MEDVLRNILDRSGRLAVPAASLDENTDLYAAGLSSLATVNVMLAIEAAFDIEIPDEMLNRRTFQTLGDLREAITRIAPGASGT